MNRPAILATILACAPALAAAQSATDDAELFPEDERVLRFGTAERHVTFAPFVQYYDLGLVESDLDGREDEGSELRLARLYLFGRTGDLSGTFAYNFDNSDFPIAYAYLTKRVTAMLDLSHTRLTAGPDDGAETTALTLRGQIAF